ncbi:MAG: hypothetical protein M1816_000389 [Peltula sp. TS41687]|nr:MAG: hypothetical protein M1816_000389 [Peltula sp. TS41687]
MTVQTSFPRSFSIIQRLKDGEDLVVEDSNRYIDDTLAVLGEQIIELGRRDGVQDNGIRQEFINQRHQTDEQFKEQRVYMHERFQKTDEKLSVLQGQLSVVQGQVSDVQGQVKDVQGQVIDVQGQVKEVKGQLQEVKRQLQELGASRFNALATRGSSVIHPVPIIETDGEYKLPKFFPRTVSKLWELRSPLNATRLFYLCDFYKIECSDDWLIGLEGEAASGELESESSAARLDYKTIVAFMAQWEEFKNRPRVQPTKRQLEEQPGELLSGSSNIKRAD